MKVLYVIDSLAPGGTENSTIVLAQHLHELDVNSTIVTLRAAEHDLTVEAEAVGIKVTRLLSASFLGRVRELRGVIRSGEYDVVHTALFKADQVGRIAAWGTGTPVVSSFVNTPYDESRFFDPNVKKWKLRLVQMIDAISGRLLVDRFHAVSEGVKLANARALRIPEARVVVAERGRDAASLGVRSDDRRSATRSALGLSQDAEVVLNLGRLDHQKGQVVLIEAASILRSTKPGLVVLIAGKDGSASDEIHRRLADDPVASACVRLLGHRSDIGDLLCAADVLAISSYFEGTAGVAVEALALSTPVVSTDLVGLRGVLEHDHNAFLARPADPEQLAAAIGALLDDSGLASRLAAQGYEDYVRRFTPEVASLRMLDLYGSVRGMNS